MIGILQLLQFLIDKIRQLIYTNHTMFDYIRGIVAEKQNNVAIIDVNGVGFKLCCSFNTLANLEKNAENTIYTHFKVSENAMDLYGFATLDERTAFEMLISISGVGPKAAISILSVLTHSELAFAVIAGEPKQITKASGVGPKLANRIILELKDKISKEKDNIDISLPADTPAFGNSNVSDATSALYALGFNGDDIGKAIKGVSEDATSEEIIKYALTKL